MVSNNLKRGQATKKKTKKKEMKSAPVTYVLSLLKVFCGSMETLLGLKKRRLRNRKLRRSEKSAESTTSTKSSRGQAADVEATASPTDESQNPLVVLVTQL